MAPKTAEDTRAEWRQLGFFYDLDEAASEWRIAGDRDGLLRFRDLLLAYVSDSRNRQKSEHEHYGPYAYLKIMTWPTAGMDADSIHGPLSVLSALADIVGREAERLQPGEAATVRKEFAPDSHFSLVLMMEEDNFDPASADPGLV